MTSPAEELKAEQNDLSSDNNFISDNTSLSPPEGHKSLLSTKVLPPAQKALLENHGFSVTEYDAITIKYLDFIIPAGYDHLIFTSQNGVHAYLEMLNRTTSPNEYKAKGCFCVGNKTRKLLEAHGLKVLYSTPNGAALARFLLDHHGQASFLYICSSRRRDELPKLLKDGDVSLKEVVGYQTLLHEVRHPQTYDALLFFSPSGVQSFMGCNSPGNATAYCIGPTTAEAVKVYTDQFKIAPEPSLEALLQWVLHDLNLPINTTPGADNNKTHL